MMPEIGFNDWLAYGILLIALLAFLSFYLSERTKRKQSKSLPVQKAALDAILHRSSESGKGIVLGLSDGDGGQSGSLAGFTGLQTQAHVFRHSLLNDTAPKVMAGDGSLVSLSQQLNAGIYKNAVMPELFRTDNSLLAGVGSYAYLAGLLPELGRPKLSTLVLQGELNPEIVLGLDLAQRHGYDSIASTSSLSGQAAFFLASPDVALGDEAFLQAHSQTQNRAALNATLKTLRVLRVLIILGLGVGIVLKILRVIP